jgi:thiol-disulfide isomerase/thioredoxin
MNVGLILPKSLACIGVQKRFLPTLTHILKMKTIILLLLSFQFFNSYAQQTPENKEKTVVYIDQQTGKMYSKYDIEGVVGWHTGAFRYLVRVTNDTVFYYLDKREYSEIKATHDSISQLIVNKRVQISPFVDIEGNTFTNSDLESKVLVFNFWATSCRPCVAEIPELNRLTETYLNQDVLFFAPLTGSNQLSMIEDFLNRKEFKYRVIIPKTTNLVDTFNAFGLPTHIIVDKNGIVRFSQFGGNPDEIYNKLDAEIRKYL